MLTIVDLSDHPSFNEECWDSIDESIKWLNSRTGSTVTMDDIDWDYVLSDDRTIRYYNLVAATSAAIARNYIPFSRSMTFSSTTWCAHVCDNYLNTAKTSGAYTSSRKIEFSFKDPFLALEFKLVTPWIC